MNTLWVFIITMSTVASQLTGAPEGFVRAEIIQTRNYYFESKETCDAAQAVVESQLGQLTDPNLPKVTISKCEEAD